MRRTPAAIRIVCVCVCVQQVLLAGTCCTNDMRQPRYCMHSQQYSAVRHYMYVLVCIMHVYMHTYIYVCMLSLQVYMYMYMYMYIYPQFSYTINYDADHPHEELPLLPQHLDNLHLHTCLIRLHYSHDTCWAHF